LQLSLDLTGQGACEREASGEGQKMALLDLTHSQLQELFLSWGEPGYRADQLYKWLYASLVTDFTRMYNIPRGIREQLEQIADIRRLTPLQEIASPDGLTRKVLFALPDGETVETVLMLYDKRNTVCVSTQIGCALGCAFCATGQSGFTRNLTAGEIVEQALHFARALKKERQRATNVVFMGMGEPFRNYEATWQAVETLNEPRGCNLGARRITISTVGIVPGIQRLSQEMLQVGLAISLHAAYDDLRDTLVPINRRYPLKELMTACQDYVERTGRRVTFEYALAQGVNDSRQQAAQLARLLDGLLCHVNLIPLNPIPRSPWQASSKERVQIFHRELSSRGINSTIRLRRGIEIEAGCGQLRSRDTGNTGAKHLRSLENESPGKPISPGGTY
jgi:23S rRNA (adenine2503-C2)-methyltransferase